MNLSDKTAVITGGGSGIGRATAELLAAEGCRVMIAGRGARRLSEALAGSSAPDRVRVHPVDVADRASVQDLFAEAAKQLGPIDILVNAAGINIPNRAFDQVTPEDWDRLLQVNATGTFNCIHAVLPQMCERGDGLIVNISSIAGKRGDMRGGMAYSAAKFAQSGLGMTLGAEVGTKGVRVTNIYPGETNTPILEDRPVRLSAEHLASILQPEDVAAAIRFVACLPPRAHVPELVITPTWQPFV
ncbi:MAG: SDR family oxidoreductase [Pirellulales bacterium]|nr:SDR family oxidoreductase [Pirellulales bacterium]